MIGVDVLQCIFADKVLMKTLSHSLLCCYAIIIIFSGRNSLGRKIIQISHFVLSLMTARKIEKKEKFPENSPRY